MLDNVNNVGGGRDRRVRSFIFPSLECVWFEEKVLCRSYFQRTQDKAGPEPEIMASLADQIAGFLWGAIVSAYWAVSCAQAAR